MVNLDCLARWCSTELLYCCRPLVCNRTAQTSLFHNRFRHSYMLLRLFPSFYTSFNDSIFDNSLSLLSVSFATISIASASHMYFMPTLKINSRYLIFTFCIFM